MTVHENFGKGITDPQSEHGPLTPSSHRYKDGSLLPWSLVGQGEGAAQSPSGIIDGRVETSVDPYKGVSNYELRKLADELFAAGDLAAVDLIAVELGSRQKEQGGDTR